MEKEKINHWRWKPIHESVVRLLAVAVAGAEVKCGKFCALCGSGTSSTKGSIQKEEQW